MPIVFSVGTALDKVMADAEVRLGATSPHQANGQFGYGGSSSGSSSSTKAQAPKSPAVVTPNPALKALQNAAAGLGANGQITSTTFAVETPSQVHAADAASEKTTLDAIKTATKIAALKAKGNPKAKIPHHGGHHHHGKGKLPKSSKMKGVKDKVPALHKAVKIPNHIAAAKDTGHITK